MQKRALLFGLGYTASRLAMALKAEGWQVAATSRQPEIRQAMQSHGIEMADFTADDIARLLPAATHILSSAPLDKLWQDPVLTQALALIEALPGLQWLGYFSTTGVYGDTGGAWVDETSPTQPVNDRVIGRITAEQAWLDLGQRRGIPAAIFRLAGIYGPGRNALVSLKEGTARPIFKKDQVFSRIHVDDIVRITLAAMQQQAGGIYNVCDDLPAAPHEVIAYAAALLGIEAPIPQPYEEAQLSPMAREFYQSNRRVGNAKITTTLGVRLVYPTYREGLRALLTP